jgi:NADPH:quinone reductase-like Zn-dependent oxidoreductase
VAERASFVGDPPLTEEAAAYFEADRRDDGYVNNGTYAVQLAKSLGADVTAVCSTRNVEQTRSLGADRVIDYTQEDFTRLGERHDLMLDIAGSRPFSKIRRVLTPEATIVVVGARMSSRSRPGL